MKKFSLSVSSSCHENWGAMTPDQNGRFCAACQKTVIDFSNMSDRQLAEFFARPTGNLCGRFRAAQMDRELAVLPPSHPWLKPFFPVAFSALALLLISGKPPDALPDETKLTELCTEEIPAAASTGFETATGEKQIGERRIEVQPVFDTEKSARSLPLSSATDTLPTSQLPADSLIQKMPVNKEEPIIMGMVSVTQYKAMQEKKRKEALQKKNKKSS